MHQITPRKDFEVELAQPHRDKVESLPKDVLDTPVP